MTFIQLQPNPPNDLFQDRLRLFQVQQSLEQQAITKQALLRDEQSRAAFGTALTAHQNGDKNGLAKALPFMTTEDAKNLFGILQDIEGAKYQAALSASKNEETNQSRTEQFIKLAYPALTKVGFDPVKGAFSESGASPAAQGALERARVTAALDSDLEIARKNYGDHLATLAQLGLSIEGLPDPKTATMNQIMNYERYIRGAQGTVNRLQNISGETQALILAQGGDPYNIDTYNNPDLTSSLRKKISLDQRREESEIYQNNASAKAALMDAKTNWFKAQEAANPKNNVTSLTPSTSMTASDWNNINYNNQSLEPTNGNQILTTANMDDLNKKAQGISQLEGQFASMISVLNSIPYIDLLNPLSKNRALFNSSASQILTTVKELEKLGALDRGVLEQFDKMFGNPGFFSAHNSKEIALNFMMDTLRKQKDSYKGTGFQYKTNRNNINKRFVSEFYARNGRPPTKKEVEQAFEKFDKVFR